MQSEGCLEVFQNTEFRTIKTSKREDTGQQLLFHFLFFEQTTAPWKIFTSSFWSAPYKGATSNMSPTLILPKRSQKSCCTWQQEFSHMIEAVPGSLMLWFLCFIYKAQDERTRSLQERRKQEVEEKASSIAHNDKTALNYAPQGKEMATKPHSCFIFPCEKSEARTQQ